jgi:site-specific DNA recombinase
VRQDAAEAAVVTTLFAPYAEERCSLFSLASKPQRDAVAPPCGKGRWTMSTVRRILTNSVHTGQVYGGRIQEQRGTGVTTRRPRPREDWIAVAPVPAVVTQEQFDRVQDKPARNQQFARRNNTAHAYLLRALVSCGVCGLSCGGRRLPAGHSHYCCRGKLAAVHSCRDTPCPSRHIPAGQLDALVWDDLCQVLTHPEAIRRALERAHGGHWLPQELRARREVFRHGQAGVQRQVERLTEAYLAGVVGLEEYRRRRRELEQREQALATQSRQLEAQVDRQAEIARLGLSMEEFRSRVGQGLGQASWEQKRQLVEWLVARVVVTDSEVEIRYVIPTSPAGEATCFCHLRSHYRGEYCQMEASDRGRAALAQRRVPHD